MDSQSLHQATAKAVSKKFGRKRLLTSKVIPHFPNSIEREYERVVNGYMKLFNAALAAHLPKLRELLERNGMRTDAADEEPEITQIIHSGAETAAFETSVNLLLADIAEDFNRRQGLFGLRGQIEKLTKLTRKLTVAEWKRVVRRTLGIDIMTDYYSGLKFQKLFDGWIAENVKRITTVPKETLEKMNGIVKQGYLTGGTTKSIAKQIKEAYGMDKDHALFIARDQTAKLNARITQEQHKDAGVTEYIWRTVGDARVRDSHHELNGERCKYSEPPLVDKTRARTANPGEDFQCRCVALPIFDTDTVVLPWEKGAEP